MTATDIDSETVSDVPRGLRPGFSIGQGVAALVIALGAVLLMNASVATQSSWGVALIVAGVVLLAVVETLRVVRRRRAALVDD